MPGNPLLVTDLCIHSGSCALLSCCHRCTPAWLSAAGEVPRSLTEVMPVKRVGSSPSHRASVSADTLLVTHLEQLSLPARYPEHGRKLVARPVLTLLPAVGTLILIQPVAPSSASQRTAAQSRGYRFVQ